MEERQELLRRRCTRLAVLPGLGSFLLAAATLAVNLFVPAPALAQAPRLAISEYGWEFAAADRTREYWEVANLGEAPWNPNDFWAVRMSDTRGTPQLFVRIQGVDPVPPGGVLLLEWGRPLDEGDLSTDCTTRGNVFCSTRVDAAGNDFDSSDFEENTAVAIFGPTSNNEPPTVADGTMLAYLFHGDVEEIDRENLGYDKAVQSKLWKDGDSFGKLGDPNFPKAIEWVVALRMAPGPYPPDHGRKAADYYLTLTGIDEVSIAGLSVTNPTVPAPNSKNRAGTPGRPNYLHPGEPIPGQIAANFLTIRAQATTASVAQNAPAAALQVAGFSREGAVATSLFSDNAWSPWTTATGLPPADALTLLNNPKRATRTLIVRAKADGALSMSTDSGGREQTFAAPVPLGIKALGTPAAAAAVDPATGNEHLLVVEAGTGAIMHNVNENGTLRGWQAIPGAKTDSWIAAAWSTDPAGLFVVAWNGNQLVLNRMGADGQFGAWQNVGTAVSARPAGKGPVAEWNPQAKRLEILALVGSEEAAEVHHTRVELTAAGDATPGSLTRIEGVTTNAAPAIAINPETGQLRMLSRGGGREPGLNPGQEGTIHDLDYEEAGPQAGFVFESIFDGSLWGTRRRIGTGRLPGPSPATPAFGQPAAPVSLFDTNTRRFQDFLIGEDVQVYHNAVGP